MCRKMEKDRNASHCLGLASLETILIQTIFHLCVSYYITSTGKCGIVVNYYY